MATVIIYTKKNCPYCVHAKDLLGFKQVSFKEISVENDPEQRATMEKLSGRRTVPQIFINGQAIGGFDDLKQLETAGKLDALLAG